VGKRIDMDDLVSAAEIAERLGVGKSTVVHDWRYRDLGFPEAVKMIGQVGIWDWTDVEKWAMATGRIK
jgi:predicted DNA-binding transcriptional regulator AlpA